MSEVMAGGLWGFIAGMLTMLVLTMWRQIQKLVREIRRLNGSDKK